MMLAALTPWGLAIWRHGTSAPLWRALVSPDNSVWINWIAALVVAACFAYAVRKLVFPRRQFGERLTHPLARLAVAFSALPFFVIPPLARQVAELSPFYFTLVPCGFSLALLASQTSGHGHRHSEDEDESQAGPNVRMILAGACAAVGSWEGALGAALSVILLSLSAYGRIRRGRSVPSVLLLWLLGYFIAFTVEGSCLDWTWGVFRPIRTPVVGLVCFGLLTVLPLALVRTVGLKKWLFFVWGGVLAVLLTNALVRGYYWKPGPCERFVRQALAELGDRELIIGDGLTDDFFLVMKPYGVRLVGTRTFEDREFLISFFGEDEPVDERALVVRDYYYLPETDEMMAAYGLRLTKLGREVAKARRTAALTPAVWEMKHAQAMTNQMVRMLALSGPVVRSVGDMLDNYENIPIKMRRKKIEEARTNIRNGWATGMAGPTLSSTILSLDVILGDWDAAESDALVALTVDREDPAANTMLGSLRLRKGALEAAERYLRKGVKGGGSGACNDYAMVLLKTDRPAKAEPWARLAVRKAPTSWNCRETLVKVLTALKLPDEAMHELQEVERLSKEQGQYDFAKEMIRKDRNDILRLRSVSSDKWGE